MTRYNCITRYSFNIPSFSEIELYLWARGHRAFPDFVLEVTISFFNKKNFFLLFLFVIPSSLCLSMSSSSSSSSSFLFRFLPGPKTVERISPRLPDPRRHRRLNPSRGSRTGRTGSCRNRNGRTEPNPLRETEGNFFFRRKRLGPTFAPRKSVWLSLLSATPRTSTSTSTSTASLGVSFQ